MTPERAPRTVLVTGGTRGIGRAIGVAFARGGERVILTHRWGGTPAAEVLEVFAAAGARAPEIVEADVASPAETEALFDHVGSGGVDVLVANVCVTGRGDGTLSARTLRRGLEYSAWPLPRYLEAMARRWGRLPRHVVASSSDGPDRFYPGYDYVAAAKAVLESLCRRLAAEHAGIRVNALRARQVDTTSYREMFGGDERALIGRFSEFDVEAAEVARATVALCGGDLDGLSGETLTVDRGASAVDNLLCVSAPLLGREPPWSGATGADGARRPGVLWVDAGLPWLGADLGSPVRAVRLSEAEAMAPEEIPAAVVVGCDWRRVPDEEILPRATVLFELLQRAMLAGPAPRYGVRVEATGGGETPGRALTEVLARYWGAWRAAGPSRLNGVLIGDPDRRAEADRAVRALLSGDLDGIRGQVLPITREALP